jgi:hypothetical protein
MRHQWKKRNFFFKQKKIVAPKNDWGSSWINQNKSRAKIGTKILLSIEPSHKHTKKKEYFRFSLRPRIVCRVAGPVQLYSFLGLAWQAQ